MPFVFQKIANYGTSSPAVARTMMQFLELQGGFLADNEPLAESVWECTQKVVKCHMHLDNAKSNIAKGIEQSLADRLKGVPSIPYAYGIEEEAEHFLIAAKHCFHRVAHMLREFFETDQFKADAASLWTNKTPAEAVAWAKHQYGVSPITALLEQSDHHVGEIVKWRNAAEHKNDSKSKSGTLESKNFALVEGRVEHPSWRRKTTGGEPFIPIVGKLEEWAAFILSYVEGAVVVSSAYRLAPIASVVKIPDKDINPDNPFRYRLAFGPQ